MNTSQLIGKRGEWEISASGKMMGKIPSPVRITWKLGMNSKCQNKIRKLLRGRKEEGEAKLEVAGPPGRKHGHLLTPEVQRTGFHLSGGRREEEPQTHASQDWNQITTESWILQNYSPSDMEAGEKPPVIKETQGNSFEWLSMPHGEKASDSENLRPQTCPHAG